MSRSFSLQANASRVPSLSQMDPEACYMNWDIQLATISPEHALQDVFMFVDGKSTPSIRAVGPMPTPSESFVASADRTSTAVAASGPPAAPPVSAVASSAELVASPADRRSGEERRAESVPAARGNDPVSTASETERVDRDRLDKMINQIGEVVIGTSMVEQDWTRFHPDTESCALVQLGKIVRDLQEMSLSRRMVPISASFQKMTRIVRDLSHRLGKQIDLETEGEDTELDKTVVDQIGDPLLYMVRNSVDHGIEAPEERVRRRQIARGYDLPEGPSSGRQLHS